MTQETFGAFLRNYREKVGYGLREFANEIGKNASVLSAIELGNRSHTFAQNELKQIAAYLGIKEGSDDWAVFFDLARKKGQIPADVQDVIENEKLGNFVFSLLRTVGRQRPTAEQIDDLNSYINTQLKAKNP